MGQDRISIITVSQSYIDTYGHYRTYRDDVSDSIKEALREGVKDPDGVATIGGFPALYRMVPSGSLMSPLPEIIV